MAGEANTAGMERFSQELRAIMERVTNPEPAYKEIGPMLAYEVIENFRVGGRPAWPPSKRVQRHGGQTLIITGRLMKTETLPEISSRGIVFGSNLPYAAIQHFGGVIIHHARSETFQRNRVTRGANKGRFRVGARPGRGMTMPEYEIRMPARPAIVFSDQALSSAMDFARTYFLGRSS